MEVLVMRHLQTAIPFARTGVVINIVCPGLCETALSRNLPTPARENIQRLREEVGRTADQGSRTLLHGAVAGKESYGQFIEHCELNG